MPDTYEQNLSSKASLTRSDYIRVVGTDNVSYKQSLSSLMDTMGVTRTLISNGVDLNTLLPNANSGTGYYRGDSISSMTNKPSDEVNAFSWALDAINVSSYIKQILHVYTAQANIVVYERIQRYSSGSIVWGNWEKMPTRAEVDALTTVSQSTLTKVKEDLTIGSQNIVYKYGRIVFVTVVFATSTNASQNDVLFTTPYAIRHPVLANIRSDNGSIYLIGTDESFSSNIKALYGSGLPAGVYRGTFTYLATA